MLEYNAMRFRSLIGWCDQILLALSKTKRFEMNTMMATKTDHEYVEKITSRLAEAGFTEQDCFVLKKRYGL